MGWSDFLRKNGPLPSCAKLLWDPNSKISTFRVANFWDARPQKMLPATQKSAIRTFLYIFKGCTWSKNCSLVCLKIKTDDKLKIIVVCPFWGPTKNTKPSEFQIFFLVFFVWSKLKVYAWFFWKWKSTIFWNWAHKNIPDWQHSARFRKSKKVLYH